MMAIDLNNLATDAKQADVSDYEQFFISKWQNKIYWSTFIVY